MPVHIVRPAVVPAAGNMPKQIEEFAGRISTGHTTISVARMLSPSGWMEPGQTPAFEEIVVVLRGMLRVDYRDGTINVYAGEAVITHPGEWVRFSTPDPEGAEHIAVCLPAFSADAVNRDTPAGTA